MPDGIAQQAGDLGKIGEEALGELEFVRRCRHVSFDTLSRAHVKRTRAFICPSSAFFVEVVSLFL
jgi:hypothetical protein